MQILGAIIFSFCAAVFAVGQVIPETHKNAKVKEELRKLLTDLNEARAKRDRAALERIYADEFLFVHSTGNIVNKTENINQTLSIKDPIRLLPIPSFDELLVYGDVAILRTHNKQTNGWGTNIYAKKDGRWQIIQIQGTELARERKAIKVDSKTLDLYVGKYERDGGASLVITREEESLNMQGEGRVKLTLLPLSETQFYYEGLNVEATFFKDEQGKVTHFIQRESNGREVKWNKVK